MECTECAEFAKATASQANGACVEVGFGQSGQSTEQSGCDQVHVRNSRFPDRVVDVPHAEWQRLVTESQTIDSFR